MYHDIPAHQLVKGASFIEPMRKKVDVNHLLGRTLYLVAQFGGRYEIPAQCLTREYYVGRNQERLDHKSLSN